MFDDEEILHYITFELYRKFQSVRCEDYDRLTYIVTLPTYLTEYSRTFRIYIDGSDIQLCNSVIIPALKSCGAYENYAQYIAKVLDRFGVTVDGDNIYTSISFSSAYIRINDVVQATDNMCRALVALDALNVICGKDFCQ